jgi:hypothetical protein
VAALYNREATVNGLLAASRANWVCARCRARARTRTPAHVAHRDPVPESRQTSSRTLSLQHPRQPERRPVPTRPAPPLAPRPIPVPPRPAPSRPTPGLVRRSKAAAGRAPANKTAVWVAGFNPLGSEYAGVSLASCSGGYAKLCDLLAAANVTVLSPLYFPIKDNTETARVTGGGGCCAHHAHRSHPLSAAYEGGETCCC